VAALRSAFPQAQVDWLVERKWAPLLEGNSEISAVIPIERRDLGSVARTIKRLRSAEYRQRSIFKGCTIRSPGPGQRSITRIGFAGDFAREAAAALMYNSPVTPVGKHVVEQKTFRLRKWPERKRERFDSTYREIPRLNFEWREQWSRSA